MRTLRPENAHLGGKGVKETIFTTNGFTKRKVDHDCFEKQNLQLQELYAKSKQ